MKTPNMPNQNLNMLITLQYLLALLIYYIILIKVFMPFFVLDPVVSACSYI